MPMERCQSYDPALAEFNLQSNLKNPCAHVLEISQRPEFRVITSLMWIRTSRDNKDVSGKVLDIEHVDHFNDNTTPCECRPDLGLLRLHRDRLAFAAEALGWRHIRALERDDYGLEILRTAVVSYLKDLTELSAKRKERLKLRIMVSRRGIINVDSLRMDECGIDEVLPRPFMPTSLDIDTTFEPKCRVYVDSHPTPGSFFTTHKTSHRPRYDAARTRANITKASPTEMEVLLYNEQSEIMEASCCTVYFRRDGSWITPAAICGGMLGVTRRLALDRGLCKQGLIELSEVQDQEVVWLSNGARGFFAAQVCLDPHSEHLLQQIPDYM
jgi:4-amino-4-deoxychorismate lyase